MKNRVVLTIALSIALVAPTLAQDLNGHWRVPNGDGPKGSVLVSGSDANYTVAFTLGDGQIPYGGLIAGIVGD